MIVQVNQTLRGWFGYFQHSSYRMSTRISISGFVAASAAFCGNAAAAAVEAEEQIISAGETATSLNLGCSVLSQPMFQPANPHEGKTINRRAGCGKPASPVRREGRFKSMNLPYPYRSRVFPRRGTA